MYHIHTTAAYVVESRARSEKGAYLLLFTREFGMIHAIASGLRSPVSKLRSSLTPHTLVHVSLVRGKDMWRVVGAHALSHAYFELKDRPSTFAFLLRIVKLLRRLLPEEGKEHVVFDVFQEMTLALIGKKFFSKEEQSSLEVVVVFSILAHLGYIHPHVSEKEALISPFSDGVILSMSHKKRADMISHINTALKASHL